MNSVCAAKHLMVPMLLKFSVSMQSCGQEATDMVHDLLAARFTLNLDLLLDLLQLSMSVLMQCQVCRGSYLCFAGVSADSLHCKTKR